MADSDHTEGSTRRLGVAVALLAACVFVAPSRADAASAACQKVVREGVLTLRANCWSVEPGGYRASGPVVVNGLELRGPGFIRIDGVNSRVRSTLPRRWLVGGVPIGGGPFTWQSDSDTWAKASGRLGRLRLTGEVQPTFSSGGRAAIDAWVVLPLLPRHFGAITGNIRLQTSTSRPFRLAGSKIRVREVRAGRLALRNLALAYSRTKARKDLWRGGLRLDLPTEAITSVGGNGAWLDGKLQRVAGAAEGDVPLMTGFTLTSLGLQLRLKPSFRLAGRATVEFGPPIGGGAALEMRAGLAFRPLSLWRLNGTIELTGRPKQALDTIHAHARLVGAARIQLDQGFLAALDGRLDVGFSRARLVGRTTGFASSRVFNLEGSVKLDMASFHKGADGLISSQGLAGCVDLGWFGPTVGMGYRWRESSPDIMFHSCKVDKYRVLTPGKRETSGIRAVRVGAAAPAGAELPAGLPLEAFAATSVTGNPNIVVAGPDGRRYDTAQIGDLARRATVLRNDVFVWHAVADHTVYLLVRSPAAGLWTVTASSRSAPLKRILAAHGLPNPRIAANVAVRTQGYVLSYQLESLGKQRVSIFEARTRDGAGAIPIVENVAASGTASFVPSPLGPRRRYLIAVVSIDGAPNELRPLGTFVVDPPPPPPAPSLTGVRSPDAVVVSWGAPRVLQSGSRTAARPRVAEWLVRDEVSDGRAEVRTLPLGTTQLRVPAEPRHRVVVTVSAIDRFGRQGTAGTLTVSAIPERPSLGVDVDGQGTVTSTPGGITCPGDCDGIYKGATVVTLSATPAPGWVFTGWTGACTGTDACRVPMTSVRDVKATFEPAPAPQPSPQQPTQPSGEQPLAGSPGPAAPGSPPPGSPGAPPPGSPAPPPAVQPPPPGPAATLSVRVKGPGTVTSTPAGIACPGDCEQAYPVGTKVVLKATPAPGAELEEWEECGRKGEDSCEVTVKHDLCIRAEFEDDDDDDDAHAAWGLTTGDAVRMLESA
jgi:Divergent InlB B-repeat domain